METILLRQATDGLPANEEYGEAYEYKRDGTVAK